MYLLLDIQTFKDKLLVALGDENDFSTSLGQFKNILPSIEQLLVAKQVIAHDLQGIIVCWGYEGILGEKGICFQQKIFPQKRGFSETRAVIIVANMCAYGLSLPLTHITLTAMETTLPVRGLTTYKKYLLPRLLKRGIEQCSLFTSSFLSPAYDSQPHITLSKKKPLCLS